MNRFIRKWQFFRHYLLLAWQYQRHLMGILKEARREGHLKQTLKWLVLDGGMAYVTFLDRFQQPTPARGPMFLRGLDHPIFVKLAQQSKNLHALLDDKNYSYSLLVPVYKPVPDFFRKTLISALEQSAPDFEVLVGFDGPQPDGVYQVCEELKKSSEVYAKRLKVFEFDRSVEKGISATTNRLANKATGKYLVMLDHDDWIRPDLLLRYEQTLRNHAEPERTLLYCNEFKIDEFGKPIYQSFFPKPNQPPFPYLFANLICHCLLVPRQAFESLGGYRTVCDGAQDYDLCLRAFHGKFHFRNVPVYLYAWRAHAGSTALSADVKDYATPAGIRALEDFCVQEKLDWKIEPGLRPTWYRAVPQLKEQPKIHAVMLYKDLREMTLNGAATVLNQTGVKVHLSCVDNGSKDTGIADDLRKLGAEVISIAEPFNFSRLNNLCVEKSQVGSGFDTVLFVNNDIELEPDALLEMARWAKQPGIGAVGARLLYPDGRLQHGGVKLMSHGPHDELRWAHVDIGQLPENMALSALTRTCEAVTGACLMMGKSLFREIHGFDALNYPIAYSDTDLCTRIRDKGLHVLYSPFAVGIHHESATRKFNSIEDFEQSRWLAESLGRHP